VIVTPVALVAATVNVDDPPGLIDVGLAAMVIVGEGVVEDPKVTVVDAEVFPPAPIAVAVYVVVVVGLTDCVPPVADKV
jgi:predicted membrane-bound spermidine synthase